MCYSAMIYAEIKQLERRLMCKVDVKWYVQTFWIDRGKNPFAKRTKAPRAMERELLVDGPPELAEAVAEADRREIEALEQEIFAQRRRVADAERALQAKATKKAANDARIGRNKVQAAMDRLQELKSAGEGSGLGRIYPGSWCPVVVMDAGRRVIRPMRYRCRLPGWTEAVERQYPGTYNARRDKLETSWGKVFGHAHGVVLAKSFYEHVDRDGTDTILEFRPSDGDDMIAACLWTHTVDADGNDLLSFALVTDEPPPEVRAAGHDRCIIPLKPEHVDTWLQPDPSNLAAQYAVLDDRQRPYYEHRQAA
jgi:putative SOS response-associated peptidase YedK